MRGAIPGGVEVIEGENLLPRLGQLKICMYEAGVRKDEVMATILSELRCAYAD